MGIVRLVARVAQHAARVLRGGHLREVLRFGRILFMTAAAEVGYVGKRGFVGRWIIRGGMRRLWSVACLAGNVGMFAGGSGFGLLVMAQNAGILSGIRDRALPNHIQGTRPVMAVLAESLGNNRGAYRQK